MANHTATLNLSVLIQDTAGPAPVSVATDSKQDQVTGLEEFISTTVVIPANTDVTTTPIVVSFAPFNVQTVYVKSDRAVTMQVGTAGADTLSIRSAYCETYQDGEGPNALEFGNADLVNAATVTVIAGSNQP